MVNIGLEFPEPECLLLTWPASLLGTLAPLMATPMDMGTAYSFLHPFILSFIKCTEHPSCARS